MTECFLLLLTAGFNKKEFRDKFKNLVNLNNEENSDMHVVYSVQALFRPGASILSNQITGGQIEAPV